MLRHLDTDCARRRRAGGIIGTMLCGPNELFLNDKSGCACALHMIPKNVPGIGALAKAFVNQDHEVRLNEL